MSDDEPTIYDEYEPGGTGIVMIVLAAGLLLALLYVFREELGIPALESEVSVPDEIPASAMSPDDEAAQRGGAQ